MMSYGLIQGIRGSTKVCFLKKERQGFQIDIHEEKKDTVELIMKIEST